MKYVKIDLSHEDADALLAGLRSHFAAQTGNALSVAPNTAGTLAWVKAADDATVSIGGAVLDIQSGSNSRAKSDMADPGWQPDGVSPA